MRVNSAVNYACYYYTTSSNVKHSDRNLDSPAKGIETAEDVGHLLVLLVGGHAALPALHQFGCDLEARVVLRERLLRLLVVSQALPLEGLVREHLRRTLPLAPLLFAFAIFPRHLGLTVKHQSTGLRRRAALLFCFGGLLFKRRGRGRVGCTGASAGFCIRYGAVIRLRFHLKEKGA